MDQEAPARIVVELVSSADVKRLEGRDDDLLQRIKQLEDRINGLHRTIYELMALLGRKK